ncbi:hypothetical protein [Micromonospora halophytica]|uniref:Uncharacterized protein n=1 Tax=Micromonospora halophytica TaxID=47864 RepID=A0A1C5HFD8_9ACTN|nr:hypothetical protein [Micromonospora halophytica]SCG44653.1 hypothetical protein GA0070560_10478 [Micromonospora halophytica]
MRQQLATTVTALALCCGAVVLVTARSWRTALRVLLDLLVAAGLLRLTVGQGWSALASAGAVILLRQLLWAGLAGPTPTTGTAVRVRRSVAGGSRGEHSGTTAP